MCLVNLLINGFIWTIIKKFQIQNIIKMRYLRVIILHKKTNKYVHECWIIVMLNK